MGNTCKPMAVLFQCMTKFTTKKKKKKKIMLNCISYIGMIQSTDIMFFLINLICVRVYKCGFPSGSVVKNLPPMQETQV